jgi:hypothetical protein
MSKQSEQIQEGKLIAQLQKLGYQYVSVIGKAVTTFRKLNTQHHG